MTEMVELPDKAVIYYKCPCVQESKRKQKNKREAEYL